MRLLLYSVAVVAAACNQDRALGGTGAGGSSDAAWTMADMSAPASICNGLGECACLMRSDCQPFSTLCWCPTQCDGRVCFCGGGTFVACEPPGCMHAGCRLLSQLGGPDANGCYRCGTGDCPTLRRTLMTRCHYDEAYIAGLTCGTGARADCVAACLSQLERCDDVGCGYCSTCDCAGTPPNAFTKCYAAC